MQKRSTTASTASQADRKLASGLAGALADCDGPESSRHLFRTICRDMLAEVLSGPTRPRTLRELADTVETTATRPGEGSRLLRVCLRQAAALEPERTLEDVATRRPRGDLRRPA